LHILLVDDNRDAARTLSMFLTACGHECRVAPNAEEALTLTADAMPDVFILDIGLPGMDGNELARQLRARQAAAKPLIIALSGYAQPDEQKKALSAGFDHYLVKPVDVDRLSELLRGVVNPQSAPGIAPSGS
jgi:DNA-binding response OmpR family regulator